MGLDGVDLRWGESLYKWACTWVGLFMDSKVVGRLYLLEYCTSERKPCNASTAIRTFCMHLTT